MSVQRGYYHVTTTKLGRDVSTKPTNFHAPVAAVYTKCALTSSNPRAKCTVQPKIMSPITNHSNQRRKFVTSMSIIPKDKIPKIVVLPSIDKDIAGASTAKQVSGKIPVSTTAVNNSIREAPKGEKSSQSQARFVSSLQTSLSTEWKKADSFDKEDTHHKEKAKRTSSLEIQCNYPNRNTTGSDAANRSSSLEFRVGGKNTSKIIENGRRQENTSASSLNRKNVQETASMDKQNVRIQYKPLRKSFTIMDRTDAKSLGSFANFNETRFQEKPPQRLRPRMLPKSRFRVKIQKCHHKSVNISDSFNVSRDKKVKPLEKASRSVVIQDKSPQRSFSVQKP
ncbi:uncharacterized protein LOC144638247 [Oculina patagonica]